MLVKELIEELQKRNPEAKVWIHQTPQPRPKQIDQVESIGPYPFFTGQSEGDVVIE